MVEFEAVYKYKALQKHKPGSRRAVRLDRTITSLFSFLPARARYRNSWHSSGAPPENSLYFKQIFRYWKQKTSWLQIIFFCSWVFTLPVLFQQGAGHFELSICRIFIDKTSILIYYFNTPTQTVNYLFRNSFAFCYSLILKSI